MKKDYEILGLSEDASIEEVRRAFKNKKQEEQKLLNSEDEAVQKEAKAKMLSYRKAYKNIIATIDQEDNYEQHSNTVQTEEHDDNSAKEEQLTTPNRKKEEPVVKEKKNVVTKKQQGNDKKQFLIYAGCGVAALLCVGLGIFFMTKSDKPNPPAKTNVVQQQPKVPQQPVAIPQQPVNTAPHVNRPQNNTQTGYIAGEEVSLRSLPSTAGTKIMVLNNNTYVNILERHECTDRYAAMLDVPERKFTYKGLNYTIRSGQALQIVEGNPNGNGIVRCRVEMEGRTAFIDIYKRDLRMLYGDVWYKVRLNNGQTGYVFGKYVRF